MNTMKSLFIQLAKRSTLTTGAPNQSPRSALAAWGVCADIPVRPVTNDFEHKLDWDQRYERAVRTGIKELSKYVYVNEAQTMEYARKLIQSRADAVRTPWFTHKLPEVLGDMDEELFLKASGIIMDEGVIPAQDEMTASFESGNLGPVFEAARRHFTGNYQPPSNLRKGEWENLFGAIMVALESIHDYYRVQLTMTPVRPSDFEWVESILNGAWGDSDFADCVVDIVEEHCDRINMFTEVSDESDKPALQLVGSYAPCTMS